MGSNTTLFLIVGPFLNRNLILVGNCFLGVFSKSVCMRHVGRSRFRFLVVSFFGAGCFRLGSRRSEVVEAFRGHFGGQCLLAIVCATKIVLHGDVRDGFCSKIRGKRKWVPIRHRF